VQAESAAEGLAKVKVREADAHAIEKQGLAEAKVTLEKMQAQAVGSEKQGLAKVNVKAAEVDVTEREGRVGAEITQARMLAEAKGTEEKGLAQARVLEAEATALEKKGVAEAVAREKMGLADATSIREKMKAEAVGLAEKAEAMKALDGVAREHEEFRLKLEKSQIIELAQIEAGKEIAEAQARVMAEAFTSAEIKIVGGDGEFFDRFVRATSVGHSIDGFVDSSATVRQVAGGYLNGDADLAGDIKALLAETLSNGQNLRDMSAAALLAKLAAGAEGPMKDQLEALLGQAAKLDDSAS